MDSFDLSLEHLDFLSEAVLVQLWYKQTLCADICVHHIKLEIVFQSCQLHKHDLSYDPTSRSDHFDTRKSTNTVLETQLLIFCHFWVTE